MDEKMQRVSSDDVDGKWLYLSLSPQPSISKKTYAIPPRAMIRPFCRLASPLGSSLRLSDSASKIS